MESSNDSSLMIAAIAMKNGVDVIASLVNQLKNQLIGKEITAKLAEHLKVFESRLNDFEKAYEADSDFDRVSTCASHVKTYATAISQSLKADSGDLDLDNIKNSISKAATELEKSIENRKIIYGQNADWNEKPYNDETSKRIRSLERRNNELKIDNEEQRQAIAKNSRKLAELESHLDTISSQVKEKLDQTNALYDVTLVELKKKEKEIAELVGVASGNVISGSYEKSSLTEKSMADYLRYGSLLCMLIIVGFVGYSFFETTTANFKWETSVFRLLFAIFLSIPAAYLARESNKHRLQQYSHLQTSLDLKAITPYIASLPAADQHRLKSEIANRLFASKNFDPPGQESYPLNIHEILVTLLNKLEFPSKKDNEATPKG